MRTRYLIARYAAAVTLCAALHGCPSGVPPTAVFYALPVADDVPLTVQFTDVSAAGDYAIVAWHWEFGDGAEADGPDPRHAYAAEGTYTAVLTVTDAAGLRDVTIRTVVVEQPPATGDTETVLLPDGTALEMVWIGPGSFLMGRYPGEQDGFEWEEPQHEVTLTQGCWMGKYEVTIGQYLAFLRATGTESGVDWDDPACPLVRTDSGYALSGSPLGLSEEQPMAAVRWFGARAFAQWLSETLDGAFRLPTEAEWEYACRAGSTTRFYWGDDPDYTGIADYAWYGENSADRTHPVGEKSANAWGLHDMSGNVFEWCADYYEEYGDAARTDPQGPEIGTYRVIRGGGWVATQGCRSAYRDGRLPAFAYPYLGFRVAR